MNEQRTQQTVRKPAATILVVDDEAMVLRACRRILEREGFRVLTANGSDEAHLAVDDNSGEIDLLLCDVLMPEVCGGELAEALRGREPALEVIFFSGHVGDHEASCQIERGDAHFLSKPFAAEDLLALIDELIGR